MTYASLAARGAIGTAAVALAALAALHVLKPDIHPGRAMISQYALGRHGWLMACCFAAFGAASASLFAALVRQQSAVARVAAALALTVVIWLSLAMMMTIMLVVGPGKTPDPNGPERFLGVPNRMFMVAYGVWLIVAAWPFAR